MSELELRYETLLKNYSDLTVSRDHLKQYSDKQALALLEMQSQIKDQEKEIKSLRSDVQARRQQAMTSRKALMHMIGKIESELVEMQAEFNEKLARKEGLITKIETYKELLETDVFNE